MGGQVVAASQLLALCEREWPGRFVVVETDEVACTVVVALRDTFEVSMGVDRDARLFGIAVRIGPNTSQTVFFGQPPLLGADEESVVEMMRRVDRWCALQLPAHLR